MKRLLVVLAAMGALLVPFAAITTADEGETVKAKLTGFDEVPAVSTTASGSFRGEISEDGTSIVYTLKYASLEAAPTQAHIHFGQPGVNGGVSVWLCSNLASPPTPAGVQACPAAPATITGTIDADDVVGPAGQGIAAGELAELVRAIEKEVAYANVHTEMFPGGEIRGDIDD
jgi:CHRD domain-containing protein